MYSRFIYAYLSRTLFEDCNLKAVHFIESNLGNASFRFSNKEEAIYDAV